MKSSIALRMAASIDATCLSSDVIAQPHRFCYVKVIIAKTADSVWTTIIRLDGEQIKLISDIVESTKSE